MMRLLLLPRTAVLVFCLLLNFISPGCKKAKDADAPDQMPVPVITTIIQKRTVARPVQCRGIVYPQQQRELYFLSAGRLAAQRVPEGRLVSKGDTIAALDLKQLRMNRLSAQTELNAARSELARKRKLLQDSLCTQRDCDEISAKITRLKVPYQQAVEEFNKALIFSPENGRLAKWYVFPGDSIYPGKPVALLIDPGPEAIARVELSEVDYHRVKDGDSAVVNMVDNPHFPLKGVVKSRSLAKTVTELPYIADLYFENPGGIASLGQQVTATIYTKIMESLVLVPKDVLIEREPHSATVFLTDEKNKYAVRRYVVTGPEVGDDIIIEKGLHDGERLITFGIERLKNSTRIMVVGGKP
ncbi:MAG: efflux RND transporter periplasmic adaptor subunit [bacterium]|nr:efflux RND transporter periplasmic adaptor subunit [bacterium]